MKLVFVILFAVLIIIGTTSARRKIRPPIPPPPLPAMVEFQKEATQEQICQKRKCYDELILPPMRAELPRGLGYFPAAVPLVSTYFDPAVDIDGVCSGASIPVMSQCSRLTLATPVCPDLAPLVRPVIL